LFDRDLCGELVELTEIVPSLCRASRTNWDCCWSLFHAKRCWSWDISRFPMDAVPATLPREKSGMKINNRIDQFRKIRTSILKIFVW